MTYKYKEGILVPFVQKFYKQMIIVIAGLFIASMGLMTFNASAATVGVDFEPSLYTTGDINGQEGWSKTGPFDVEVVAGVTVPGFGDQSLRISNATTSNSFGDQTFAPELADAAGESTIATNNHFEAEFDINSTMLDVQPGLALSVSPDDGNGSRMSYLSFSDEAGGIRVTFYDVTNAGPLPSGTSFNPTDLGLLDRSESHTIKFVMHFVDGAGNDIVEIFVDDVLVHTGTSWEDYYRFDSEQTGNSNQLFPVDTLIFRAGGTPAPTTLGGGYLFDNISLLSSLVVPTPVATEKSQCKKGGWMNFADSEGNTFKNQGQCVAFVASGGKNIK